jgi:hypothetical protein
MRQVRARASGSRPLSARPGRRVYRKLTTPSRRVEAGIGAQVAEVAARPLTQTHFGVTTDSDSPGVEPALMRERISARAWSALTPLLRGFSNRT